MSFVDRVKARFASPLKRIGGEEDAQFTLRLPVAPGSDRHWLEIACVLHNEEKADGEHLHIKSHLRADFAQLLRALPAPAAGTPDAQVPPAITRDTPDAAESRPRSGRASSIEATASVRDSRGASLPATLSDKAGRALTRGVQGAGGALTRVLQSRPLRRVLEPVADQRVESWMDIRATDAPLDHDSRALLPAGLGQLGVAPDPDGPPIQSWAAPTPRGMAQVTTMHLDEKHLVQSARARRAGKKPLRVAAAFAQIVETSDGGRDDEV